MIRVLIVDDTATSRQLLRFIISSADDMQVIGEAVNGKLGVELTAKLKPDVVLMDITMPLMDGMEATAEIMRQTPTPIVMISASIAGKETEMAFQAIRQGALTLMTKPVAPTHPDYSADVQKLISTVRAMASVHVIHHIPKREPKTSKDPLKNGIKREPEVVAIVSSTGGPAALSEILSRLPATFPLPIVIVQHISADFLQSLRDWLDGVSPLNVQLARQGDIPQPGNVYFAPGGLHLTLNSRKQFLHQSLPVTAHIPSGNILLEAVAEHYGAAAIGIVLTGMGSDGAYGLQRMAQVGAITIAQDENTSAVFGMPQEAIRLGAARHILPLLDIPRVLMQLTENYKDRSS